MREDGVTLGRWMGRVTARAGLAGLTLGIALVLAVGPAAAAGSGTAAAGRMALVIANARYRAGGVATGVAENSAVAVDALRRAGFTVTVADDLDRNGMAAALSRFTEALRDRGQLGFLYYSGLGLSQSDKSFLVPVDAKLASDYDVVLDTVELDSVLKRLHDTGRPAVAVFDTVPDHPLTAKLAPPSGKGGSGLVPALTTPAPLDGLFVVYAHRPGVPAVPPPAAGPTPFTAALAREMVKPGVSLRDAMADVARAVVESSKGAQHPWLMDRLGGDLVLVPGAATATQTQPAGPTPEPQPSPPSPPSQTQTQTPPSASASPEEIAVDPLDETRVVARDTNLRAAPDIRAAVVGVLRRDSRVAVTGRARHNGGWLRVEQDGRTGYVSAATLVPAGTGGDHAEAAGVGAGEPIAPPPTLMPGLYTVTRPTNLFTVPRLGARSLADLEAGAPVTVMETGLSGNWVRARDRFGQEGYLSAGTLAPRGRALDTGEGRATSEVAGTAPIPLRPAAAPPAGLGGASEPEGLPGGGGSPTVPSASPAVSGDTADPFRQAIESGRAAAARAVAGPDSAAGRARAADGLARRAEAAARQAAAKAAEGPSDRVWGYRFANGDVYEGAWARPAGGFPAEGTPIKQGVGLYRFANGQIYAGEWRDDAMAGPGVLTYPSGDRFAGTFRGNLPDGPGVYHFANGEVYSGEVRQGRVSGVGELVYGNGDRYDGSVVDRLPDGWGELIQNDGSRYVGRFRQGIPDGPGAMTVAGGALQPGYWHGATRIGQ